MTNLNLDKHLKVIESLIQNNKSRKACIEFSKLIKELEENNNENLPWLYYEYALLLFNNHFYEDCLIMFNHAYNNNYMKKEIKEIILNCFILPNLNEFKTAYNNNLNIYNSKNKYFHMQKVEYENLTLEFIPIYEDKYYIFDIEHDTFNGLLDLNSNKTQDNIKFEDEFSDILIVDNGDLSFITPFLNNNNNRTIYYLSENPSKLISFLKVPKIMDNHFNNVIIFESPTMLYNFFRTNSAVYLPHILLNKQNCPSFLEKKVQSIIDEEHKFRISYEGKNDDNILLSICIPTWNRGHRALDCVMSLLESHYDSEIEIIVSDNNSDKFIEYYKQIENFPDSRIKYFKSESNTGFLGNYCRVIELSKGKFSLILSDEDKVNLETLPHYMSLLKNNPNLGLVRSGSSIHYANLNNVYAHSGSDAFFKFFLSTNYMPGIIYNTQIVNTHCLINFIINNQTNTSCFMYPHMWLDALISFKGDCCSDNNILCIEGESELKSQIDAQDDIPVELDASSHDAGTFIPAISELDNLPTAYSYEHRIEQHFSFVELINSLPLESDIDLLNAYFALCWKTNFLVSLVKPTYIKHGHSWNNIYDELYKCCIDGIDKLHRNFDSKMQNSLVKRIKEINQRFR